LEAAEVPIAIRIKKNMYRDSVFLMRLVSDAKTRPGVHDAAIVIGTEENKTALIDGMMLKEDISATTPNDVIIVVDAEAVSTASDTASLLEDLLSGKRSNNSDNLATVPTLSSALSLNSESNFALISIPGQFVKREAFRALHRNLNLMIFSSNVPNDDELEIKKLAGVKELLVMGPDCGTAIIRGAGLGFANRIRKGPIGVVGASGTGIQEVTTIIHKLGSGVTHAIGTGSNDVSAKIGGLTMLKGLRLLDDDNETQAIVVVSKPPDAEVQSRIVEAGARCRKPVIFNFLGSSNRQENSRNIIFTHTLEETAYRAVATVKGEGIAKDPFQVNLREFSSIAKSEYAKLNVHQTFLRGLFSGGTFCNEACALLADFGFEVHTNTDFPSAVALVDSNRSVKNTLLDLGAEEFTSGKPHPMIEPSMRDSRLIQEASDPTTAVILLDFVIGYGCHHDPVGALSAKLLEAKQKTSERGGHLSIVASVCGTEDDPQRLSDQVSKLEKVGVIVMPSNCQATKMAAMIAARGKIDFGRNQ
jgi:succinyl-CoA synthetase alpha subunit